MLSSVVTIITVSDCTKSCLGFNNETWRLWSQYSTHFQRRLSRYPQMSETLLLGVPQSLLWDSACVARGLVPWSIDCDFAKTHLRELSQKQFENRIFFGWAGGRRTCNCETVSLGLRQKSKRPGARVQALWAGLDGLRSGDEYCSFLCTLDSRLESISIISSNSRCITDHLLNVLYNRDVIVKGVCLLNCFVEYETSFDE